MVARPSGAPLVWVSSAKCLDFVIGMGNSYSCQKLSGSLQRIQFHCLLGGDATVRSVKILLFTSKLL